jgi:hypothetical protein
MKTLELGNIFENHFNCSWHSEPLILLEVIISKLFSFAFSRGLICQRICQFWMDDFSHMIELISVNGMNLEISLFLILWLLSGCVLPNDDRLLQISFVSSWCETGFMAFSDSNIFHCYSQLIKRAHNAHGRGWKKSIEFQFGSEKDEQSWSNANRKRMKLIVFHWRMLIIALMWNWSFLIILNPYTSIGNLHHISIKSIKQI